jgi:protein FrlC
MKLAYSSNGFTEKTLLRAIEEIALLGYQGVEILADKPHAFPPSADAPWVPEIIRHLDKYGIHVSNINGNTAMGFFSDPTGEPTFEPSLCNARQEVRNKRLHYTKGCIDLAHVLGVSNISITSGTCLPGNPPKEAMRYFIESLMEVMDYAEKNEINVGIEYEPGLLVENGDELYDVIQTVGSKRLGANLDLGHAAVCGENIDSLLKKLGPRIWNIHLEDIHEQKHYHLIPGEGTMNFNHIFDVLNSIQYQGFITVELYSYAHDDINTAKKSIEFLQSIIKGEMKSEIF